MFFHPPFLRKNLQIEEGVGMFVSCSLTTEQMQGLGFLIG
jgi:hypothetical protein